ncbi:hypothetical protein Tco_1073593 [Tanacetum coccineum]
MADSLAHEQQYSTIDIPSQPVIVGPTSTLSGTCASGAGWCLFPFAPDAIPNPSARVPNPKHNHAAQRTLHSYTAVTTSSQQQCLSDTEPEGIPNPKNIRPRPETPNQSRTIIPDVYRQKKQPPMRQQQTITTNVYRQRNQTTRYQQQTNETYIQQPQPRFQRPLSSDTKPARICDPKSIRPRYETVTERPTSFERRRLPTLLYLLEALLDVLYGALNLIFLSAIRGLGDILPKDSLIWRLKLLKSVKLGVVGFSMGVAMSLYCATCRALGQYGNGIRFPINLSAVMDINGWLPCSRIPIQSFASPLVVLTADHCLLKDLVQFDSLKLPLTLPCQVEIYQVFYM